MQGKKKKKRAKGKKVPTRHQASISLDNRIPVYTSGLPKIYSEKNESGIFFFFFLLRTSPSLPGSVHTYRFLGNVSAVASPIGSVPFEEFLVERLEKLFFSWPAYLGEKQTRRKEKKRMAERERKKKHQKRVETKAEEKLNLSSLVTILVTKGTKKPEKRDS